MTIPQLSKLSCVSLWLLMVMAQTGVCDTTIVPGSLLTTEGQGASAGFAVRIRLQEMYSASLFPDKEILIREIRFRPDVTYAVGPFQGTLADIRFTLSTTTRPVSSMSHVFDDNLSGDAIEVYSGPWTISTAFEGPLEGPKRFDVVLPLQRPFRYDPRKGNLVLDYRNFSTLPLRFHSDAASIPGGPVKMFFADGNPNAGTGVAASDGADVLELVWSDAQGGPPFITSDPQDQSVEEGGEAVFSVEAGGAPELNYFWYKNGVQLSVSNSPVLRFKELASEDSGSISVNVVNGFGSVTSRVARLEIVSILALSKTIPSGLEDKEGSGAWATFSNPIRIQELYESTEFLPVPIYIRELRFRPDSILSASAITQALTRVSVRLSSTAVTAAQLSKTFAFNTGSDEALVYDGPWTLETTFDGPPNGPKSFDIVLKLQNIYRYDPSQGNLLIDLQNFGALPVRFHHDAHSNPGLSSQQQRPVAAIVADQNPFAGSGSTKASAASVIHLVFSLAPSTPPVIVRNPVSSVQTEGEEARLSVDAIGSNPLSYQWFHGILALADATNSSLTIPHVTLADVGKYSVIVSNSFGSVRSQVASLAVTPSFAAKTVVPETNSSSEGAGASAGFSVRMRMQELYSSSLFPQQPIVIHEIRFRPDITYAVGAFTGSLGNIVFRLSTSGKPVGGLSRVFDENFGTDAKEVFRGNWEVSTAFTGPPQGPKAFDVRLPLQESFRYDPRMGNLLMEYRNYSTLPLRFHVDAGSVPGNGLSMVFSDGQPDASVASVQNLAAEFIEVVYTLDDSVPPALTRQPVGATVVQGAALDLTGAAIGGLPLTFRWFFNDSSTPISVGASLQLTNITKADAGFYRLVVTNRNGAVTSAPANLVVVDAPGNLAVVPPTAAGIEGDSASAAFSVPIRQQELYSASILPQGPIRITQLRLRMDSKLATSGGAFATTISNIQIRLSTTSRQPGDLSFTFSENVGSDEKVVFNGPWYLTSRNLDIPGAPREFDLILQLMEPFDYDAGRGNLLVETRNFGRANRLYVVDGATHNRSMQRIFIEDPGAETAVGGDDSASVLEVGFQPTSAPPSIVKQPEDLEVMVGQEVSLTVKAAGSLPLSYRWFFNGTEVPDATGSQLRFVASSLSRSGVYSVEVSNLVGTMISRDAVLTVRPGPTKVVFSEERGYSGDDVSVGVWIASNGGENALSFSLSFDPTVLTLRDARLERNFDAATLNVNTTDVAVGRIGFAIALPADQRMDSGYFQICKLRFHIAPLTSNVLASILPVDQPVAREVVDVLARPLLSEFTGGRVEVVFRGFEGDVAPRPEGDRRLTVADWVQVGRFVAGLDDPGSIEEYQRIDCAPAATSGDGRLSVKDWVQSGRYAANLDSLVVMGGPSSNLVASIPDASPSLQGGPPTTLALRKVQGEPGDSVVIPLNMFSVGGEAGLGLSVRFDASALSFIGVDPGPDSTGAILNVNPRLSNQGRIGIVLALPGGTQFSAGEKAIANLKFAVRSVKPTTTELTFDDLPVVREVVDAGARDVPVSYTPGAITIAIGAPELSVVPDGAFLAISWPAAASGFTLESSQKLLPPAWTAVNAQPERVGDSLVVRLLRESVPEVFYRLKR